MKIAININELTLEQNTGVKVYTREIVKALGRVDKENEYILYMNSPLKTELNSKISELNSVFNGEFGKFKNFKLKSSKSHLPFWTYTKLPQEIKKDQPDVLFMPIQAVPFFKKPKNLKIVVTVHDLAFLLFPDYFTRKDRFLLDFHTKRAVKMADKIIVPSEATKRDIVKFYGTSPSSSLSRGDDKISVIYHGVTLPSFPIPPLTPPKRGRTVPSLLEEDRWGIPYILFVGSIQPRKNITGLIEAFEAVKRNCNLYACHSDRSERGTSERSGGIYKHKILTSDKNNFKNTFYPLTDLSTRSYRRSVGMTTNILFSLKLVICGGRGWMADEIYERAGKSKFSKDIIFTGGVSDEERNELYKNALIFALPSFYEGFGLPILEAMSFGVPCVVGDNSSLSEIAGDDALLVDANNSDDIAEKINLLLSDSELRKDLSRRGIENVKRFSWDKAAKETLKVFKEVVSSK